MNVQYLIYFFFAGILVKTLWKWSRKGEIIQPIHGQNPNGCTVNLLKKGIEYNVPNRENIRNDTEINPRVTQYHCMKSPNATSSTALWATVPNRSTCESLKAKHNLPSPLGFKWRSLRRSAGLSPCSHSPVTAQQDVLEGYLRPTWSCFKDTLVGLNEVNLILS